MLDSRRALKTGSLLFLGSWILFLYHIQFPRGHCFDEFHYIPAAQQWLTGAEVLNLEHPPLGKYFIALGIALWGDIPLGWRFMSSLFGSLTLVGIWFWARTLLQSEKGALWVAAITLCNQLLYVQSRIGMLDTFMFGFLTWALATLTSLWLREENSSSLKRKLNFLGVMLGLAIACKWFAGVAWLGVISLLGLRSKRLSKQVSVSFLAWTVIGLPVLTYFLTFIPYFFVKSPIHSLADLFRLQRDMYSSQLRVVTQHPYMSGWVDWPLLNRPIWYAFDKEGVREEWVRGVLLLGNPIVMISGLIAIAACFWDWVEKRRQDSFLIVYFWVLFYGSWVLIPRKISFYYYYYPAGMILGLALGRIFFPLEDPERKDIRALRALLLFSSAAIFIYFYPILSALLIPTDSFRKWMWLPTWI